MRGKPNIYKENYELRKKVEEMRDGFKDISMEIYKIGGPLNDNVLNFNKKQKEIFFRIATISDIYISADRG